MKAINSTYQIQHNCFTMASAAERRQIFLACKTIFSGPNALLRKPRTIERHLAEHQASLQLSIPSFDIARVTDVLRPLLAKKVFQSETQAKMEFPDLFAPQAEGSQPEPAPSATEMVAELDPFNKREKAESTEVPPLPMPSEVRIPSDIEVAVEEESTFVGKPASKTYAFTES